MLASQLDAGEYKVSKNEVNISELAKRVYTNFSVRNSGHVVSGDFEDDLYITGEELLLEMMMSNLIENAIKYSPTKSAIKISLYKDNKRINFTVRDEGPGIAEEEKNKIFEKFYRVGNEATRTTKGTGLGLYLCKQIAKDHNAEISVTDNDAKGSVFTVTFKI